MGRKLSKSSLTRFPKRVSKIPSRIATTVKESTVGQCVRGIKTRGQNEKEKAKLSVKYTAKTGRVKLPEQVFCKSIVQ